MPLAGMHRVRMRKLADKILQGDVALFRAVTRARTPWLDRVLPSLSRAADHSRIWFAAAVVLALAGGRRGQRAALRGVGSIVVTSGLVNQIVKRLVRRPRPRLRRVPAARRLDVQPLTTSFPSGHAASAAAFATGVSSEYPRAGAPLAGLAAAVGYSRTYVGVHYPLDVVVGAATGTAIGLLTRLLWPVLPSEVEEEPSVTRTLQLPASPDGEGVALVFNREAGSPLTTVDPDELQKRLPRARIVTVEDGAELPRALAEAAKDCRVLGVCGGDGSTATAARIALEHDKPLLLVPAGTLNHLGRDLRVESLDDAIGALAAGEAVAIDLGEIDGRPFINMASFGGYTAMLEARARLQKRIGRWPAHLVAVAVAIFRAQPLALRLGGDDRRAWMVFIGNCRHEPRGFAPSWRPRLDDGLLDVRVLSGEHPLARLRLLVSILTGRLTHSVAYEQRCVPELDVTTAADSLPLASDGDSFGGSGSFSVRKLPRQLVVYAPTERKG